MPFCHIRQELSILVVIGTKAKYTQEIAALQQAIDERGAIEIHRREAYYPPAAILIYEVGATATGNSSELGIVVSNITTIWHIHQALQGNAVTEKYITVTEQWPIRSFFVPWHTVADCIAAAGSYVPSI